MKKILVLGAALVAFALVGCDAAKEAGDAYQDAKSTIQAVVDSDMTPESVKKYAKIAAEIEADPSKIEDTLKAHGVSKEDFDKAVKAIQDNPELKKVFEAAKSLQ